MNSKFGTVKFYNQQRHFGFISSSGGDFYFDQRVLRDTEEAKVIAGASVVFEVAEDHRGRKKAVNVVVEGAWE